MESTHAKPLDSYASVARTLPSPPDSNHTDQSPEPIAPELTSRLKTRQLLAWAWVQNKGKGKGKERERVTARVSRGREGEDGS